jgi:hypothetical protein
MTITLRNRNADLAAAPVLFIDNGGRVVCTDERHAGAALHAALRRDPDVDTVDTALANWERLTPAEVVDYAITCEECRR